MEINYVIYAPYLADLLAVEPDDHILSEYREALAKRLADAYPGAVVEVRVVQQRAGAPSLTGALVIDDDGAVIEDLAGEVTDFANQVLDEIIDELV
jgi:hypothetical protein